MSLACPVCGRTYAGDERFCHDCGIPLVAEGGPDELEVDEATARMRKVKPQLAEGALVTVAIGRHQPEAELIQNLLLEEGVPSTLRRSRGFDVPEMLAAGPRDVLVPESGIATAREVLMQADLLGSPPQPTRPGRILAGLLAGVAIVALIVVVLDVIG